MEEWIFTPSTKKGIGGKVNNLDVSYGWYSKHSDKFTHILCVTDIGIYVSVFEDRVWKNTELRSKEILFYLEPNDSFKEYYVNSVEKLVQSEQEPVDVTDSMVADLSYKMADAMMKAREQ